MSRVRPAVDGTQTTPGPWRVERQGFQWMIYAPSGEVAQLTHGDADARLIAAAPQMREALPLLMQACDELMTEFISKKRAANWGVINDALVRAGAALRAAATTEE